MINKEDKLLFFISNLASGGAAGASTLSIVYPLDFARTRLAIDAGKHKKDRKFTGVMNCLSKIYKSDGIRGVYRGYCISIVGIVRYRAMYFGLFDTGRDLLFPNPQKQNFIYMWLLGFITTSIAGFTSYPLDTVRRRLMMNSGIK